MTDTRREAAIEKAIEAFWAAPEAFWAAPGHSRVAMCVAIRAAVDAYEAHLPETQPASAPSGMTEAVRTLARVVEELVNQSGALTCGITALIERQRDIRSVHDALDKESDKKHHLVYDLVAAIRDLRAEAAAATRRHPPGCPDPDWCRGNRECRWDCCGKECETEEASHAHDL